MDFQKDLEKIKAAIAKKTSTEESYRGFVALIIFAVGYFGVIGKLSTRLEEARVLHEATTTTAQFVTDIRHFEGQSKIYSDRMTPADDNAEWGQYILDILDESGAQMQRFSPDKGEGIGNYKVLKFEVGATGDYYQLVDFMDRLERGERFVRVDDFDIAAEQSTLKLRCRVLCLAGVTYEATRLRQLQGEMGMQEGADPSYQPEAPAPEPEPEIDTVEASAAITDPPTTGDAS
jgi:hypothetical protein